MAMSDKTIKIIADLKDKFGDAIFYDADLNGIITARTLLKYRVIVAKQILVDVQPISMDDVANMLNESDNFYMPLNKQYIPWNGGIGLATYKTGYKFK